MLLTIHFGWALDDTYVACESVEELVFLASVSSTSPNTSPPASPCTVISSASGGSGGVLADRDELEWLPV